METNRELYFARFQAQKRRHELLGLVTGNAPLTIRQEHSGLIEKASEVVRNHPISSAGAGLALGFALASCNQPLMKEIEKSIREVSSRVTREASTVAHEAFSNSVSGIVAAIARQVIAKL